MSGRIALVTGASGGIGRAVASRLADQGYAVIVHYATRDSEAAAVAREILESGGRAWAVGANLANADEIFGLRDHVVGIVAEHPELHLQALVNNASLMLGPGFGSVSAEEFDRYVAVNLRAPLLLTQALVPEMSDGGSVVNISSAAAHFASPGDLIYAVTKSALESFTRHAAPALAKQGVRINTVIPGFTDNGHPAFEDPAVRAHMGSFAAMGGIAAPTHIADAVSFLVSENSARTTGASLDVSGGSTIGSRTPGGQALSLRDVASKFG